MIENGIGYDSWVSRLLPATQVQQTVLNVGTVLGAPAGGNPHRWYNLGNVHAIITAMVADFSRADPADRAYFRHQSDHRRQRRDIRGQAHDRQPDPASPDQDLRLQQPERHTRRPGPAGKDRLQLTKPPRKPRPETLPDILPAGHAVR